jgi:hypothetical protein
MALGLVKDEIGIEAADKISRALECIWNGNSEDDQFA